MRNIFFLRHCILLYAFFSLSIYLSAQVDTGKVYRLNEVEIIAKNAPSTLRSTSPMQKLTSKDISRLGINNLTEAVKRFSGVTVQDYGGIGGLKTVSVRSLGAKHTAVSYDGITITDAQSGQVDISRFSLDNVDLITLSIGQSDDIFQTARMSASAGVLTIKTKRPIFTHRPYHLKFQIKSGSFGMFNSNVQYEQKLKNNWYASIIGDFQRADSRYSYTLINGDLAEKKKRRNSDIQTWRTECNISGKIGLNGNLSLKGYYFNSERGLPGSIILYTDNNKERLWDKNAFIQTTYEQKINNHWKYQLQGKYNYAWMRHLEIANKYESGEQDDHYTQNEYYLSGIIHYYLNDHISFNLAEDFFINTLDNTIPECPFPKRYSSLTALSGQYKTERLTLTGNLLATYINEKVKSGNRPKDRQRISPSIGVSWKIFPEQFFRLRFSYKDIFRVPTFNDLYYLRLGNTNLRPEKATQYNLGISWNKDLGIFRYLNISVDGYYNRVKDKIVAIPTMFIWKMMNMGKVSIGGIDTNLSAEAFISKQLSLNGQLSYTWQRAIDITDKEAKNYKDQIPYTPRHSGNFTLSAETPWINMSYGITAISDRYFIPQNIKRNEINGYIEQNISINHEFHFDNHSHLRLQLEVLNIGNKNYDVIKYYPMPGRSFRAGIIYTL